MNLTRNHEVVSSIPGLAHGLRIRHCHELWHRLAAVAPIGPPAWESSYAVGVALLKRMNIYIYVYIYIYTYFEDFFMVPYVISHN